MDSDSLIKRSQALLQDSRVQRWAAVTIITGLVSFGIWRQLQSSGSRKRLKLATRDDPSLLRKHSTYESYTTASGYHYPSIRTFYKEHHQAEQLPKDLPLLVFVHGLGGSTSQFASLLTSLINTAPCFAIDWPGCGLSEFSPDDENAYTTHALAELLAAAISRFRGHNQKIVLIGHSMGCSIAALLVSSTSPLSHFFDDDGIEGLVAICPKATPLTNQEARSVNLVTSLPIPIFNMLRLLDRRGGLASRSVTRMVGESADEETRKLQLKYNEQSQSEPLLRILRGSTSQNGMPGEDIWTGIKVPLYLVAGAADKVTSSSEVDTITGWLTAGHRSDSVDAALAEDPSTEMPKPLKQLPLTTTVGDVAAVGERSKTVLRLDRPKTMPPRTESGHVIQDEYHHSKHWFVVKTTVFPEPAAHGLMYHTSTVRVLSGMIANFLSEHVDERLGAGWQLTSLTSSGKWDVKNLKKWQATAACSEPIGSIFRAMKTMREMDDEHSPAQFVKKWSSNVLATGVAVVIDISHETPVYHPSGLENAGIQYHKFPTVSKETPKVEEVERFIALIDKLLEFPTFDPDARSEPTEPSGDGNEGFWPRVPTIGVHCHYGFNRTGFFIVSYLVQRKGYKLEDAIEEFRMKRPPGIKHDHFVDELYVRFAVKMERRGTIVE